MQRAWQPGSRAVQQAVALPIHNPGRSPKGSQGVKFQFNMFPLLACAAGRLNRVTVDSGGSWGVTCSDDGSARVWELDTGKCLAVLAVSRQGG